MQSERQRGYQDVIVLNSGARNGQVIGGKCKNIA
jgi:hypothetical protein